MICRPRHMRRPSATPCSVREHLDLRRYALTGIAAAEEEPSRRAARPYRLFEPSADPWEAVNAGPRRSTADVVSRAPLRADASGCREATWGRRYGVQRACRSSDVKSWVMSTRKIIKRSLYMRWMSIHEHHPKHGSSTLSVVERLSADSL